MPTSADPFMPGPEWAAIVASCAAKLPGMPEHVRDYYLARDECSWADATTQDEISTRTCVRAMAEAIRRERARAGVSPGGERDIADALCAMTQAIRAERLKEGKP